MSIQTLRLELDVQYDDDVVSPAEVEVLMDNMTIAVEKTVKNGALTDGLSIDLVGWATRVFQTEPEDEDSDDD